ncbi:MAG: hypothetical protein GWN99_16740 [Gemmatimonadetes bacterium]|uniref:Type 4 fimbrial biogenesis protein PilX N-terminal domain-containing protein n=1 Tax=Candidatus Kutchimonas denitrificans TaxID=3056748 RepID=A0AAE4Z6Z1_9BACT|nr:hypothetical protein [Gemmatimonadota bacterium]NIR74494.1 hypothetical protein [Candidatus Kutchimonas denitrificans]NIS02684.1 hypothetical protein [Gemmatimonadota bacterium]NIT68845.1 hypothetical protein [Gemmatimonadota bacterium]NIU52150.1 hypothetical protein [Gemmatimonadota bacterium]
MSTRMIRNETGLALLAVLLAMALLTAIGAALTAVGIVEYRTSLNHRSATRALLLADGGATHALGLMRGPLAGYTYTDIILGADRTPNTADDGLLDGFLGLDSDDALPDGGVTLPHGRYSVRIVNDDGDPSGDPYIDTNNRFIALCRGETPDGGVAEVRVMLAAPSYPAVATRGDLYVPGDPAVLGRPGKCGGVHANRVISVSGHPIIDGGVTATEDVIVSGTIYDSFGNIVEPAYAPPIEIPDYEPMDYCASADFVLRDKKIYVTGPPEEMYPLNPGKFSGWQWDTEESAYVLNASDAVEGTVCADGNIKVNGNLGSTGDPFNISFLATGSVQLGGTPIIEAAHPDGILVMAGGDAQLGGNLSGSTPYYAGMIYAGAQCQVNGNPLVEGHIVCADNEDPYGANDLFDDNKINGTPTINYDCSGVQRRTLMAAWWESRTL